MSAARDVSFVSMQTRTALRCLCEGVKPTSEKMKDISLLPTSYSMRDSVLGPDLRIIAVGDGDVWGHWDICSEAYRVMIQTVYARKEDQRGTYEDVRSALRACRPEWKESTITGVANYMWFEFARTTMRTLSVDEFVDALEARIG